MNELKVGEIIKCLHDMLTTSYFLDARDSQAFIHVIGQLRTALNNLLSHFERLNLAVPTQYARDAINMLNLSPADFDKNVLDRTANLIVNTTEIELRSRLFVELDVATKRYYSESLRFFESDFSIKFSEAVFELDEAGKCFALNRPTATVFHLMRLMEIAIRAVARCLQIPDPIKPAERNWGIILRNVKTAIEDKTKSGWQTTGDKELFESAYGSLDAVRIAWRNPTMHVENKYTTEEAEHIFVAVRGFMRNISARLDQDGKPFA